MKSPIPEVYYPTRGLNRRGFAKPFELLITPKPWRKRKPLNV